MPAGELQLRDPLRAWPRFTWWLGPVLAVLLLLVPPRAIPVEWVAALMPGASSATEVVGGVEPTGGYVLELLKAGKPVVSSNKQLVAQRAAEKQSIEQQGRKLLSVH